MALMFQRLARNFVKEGYFPTDADTNARILSMLEPVPNGNLRIIDPCAGEGVALAECKRYLGEERTEAYGVEFDDERAWHAKGLLDRVIHGDFQDTIISWRSFGLLFLNPPYGDLVTDKAITGDAGKGRQKLEKLFYQRGIRLLQPGGILVLIVPYTSLDKEFCGWIASHCEAVVVYRSPVDTYRQAVVVGRRRAGIANGEDTRDARDRLLAVGSCERTDVLPAVWQGEPYAVPAPPVNAPALRFNLVRLDAAQLREEIRRYPCLWPQFELHFGQRAGRARLPLRALSRWHLALSLAAGQVCGVVRSNDGTRAYLIKGDTFKQKRVDVTVEHAETPAGRQRSTETRVATDVFVPVIRALDLTQGSPSFGKALVIQ